MDYEGRVFVLVVAAVMLVAIVLFVSYEVRHRRQERDRAAQDERRNRRLREVMDTENRFRQDYEEMRKR